MSDPPAIDRDASWQMIGRSMAAAMSRSPGLVVRVAPGAWRVTSDVDMWMANWLVCHGMDTASLALFREGLEEAVASGRTTSVPVRNAVRDQILPLFEGCPVISEGLDPIMWRDARPIPPNPRPYPGNVAQVDAGADLTAVLDLISRAFDVDKAGTRLAMAGALDHPAMSMFTATSDTLDSLCMIWTEARLTYIYLMATDPDRQRRGAGWAVMARAMEAAIQDGATAFFLEASGAGEGLYRQLGYEIDELLEFWVINPPEEPETTPVART
jgi:ribosomal protein S18 acetylase RimI-like enzyme